MIKHRRTRLTLDRETLRALTVDQMRGQRGGFITESDVCGPSDASSCPTHDWSCVNMSCTLKGDTA